MSADSLSGEPFPPLVCNLKGMGVGQEQAFRMTSVYLRGILNTEAGTTC